MAPIASGVFVGFGIYVIFLQCFNYLIDSYLHLLVTLPLRYPSSLTQAGRHLSLQPTPSSGLQLVHASLYFPGRCSRTWESSGQARCWDAWQPS